MYKFKINEYVENTFPYHDNLQCYERDIEMNCEHYKNTGGHETAKHRWGSYRIFQLSGSVLKH